MKYKERETKKEIKRIINIGIVREKESGKVA